MKIKINYDNNPRSNVAPFDIQMHIQLDTIFITVPNAFKVIEIRFDDTIGTDDEISFLVNDNLKIIHFIKNKGSYFASVNGRMEYKYIREYSKDSKKSTNFQMN